MELRLFRHSVTCCPPALSYNCRMKTSVVLILSMIAGGLSSPEGRGSAQETQVRGYWSDPATGLMWAGKDNGKDVSRHNA
jgi:hypothetical protein